MGAFDSTLITLLAVWGTVTGILVLTLIYRRTLTSREEDQIFLDPAERRLVNEQRDIVARLRRLSRPIVALSVLSAALFVAMVGVWLWQGLNL
jgi:hypothetical protein